MTFLRRLRDDGVTLSGAALVVVTLDGGVASGSADLSLWWQKYYSYMSSVVLGQMVERRTMDQSGLGLNPTRSGLFQPVIHFSFML